MAMTNEPAGNGLAELFLPLTAGVASALLLV